MAFLDSVSLKINHPADVGFCVLCMCACVLSHLKNVLGIVFDKVKDYKGHKEVTHFDLQ